MNRYRLTSRLESGELAELYRARDEGEGIDVVVKLFHTKTSDIRYAQVVAETAQVLNPLMHEGIVHYVDVGLARGRLAVVREYVDGFLLGQVLQRLNSKEVVLSPEMALYFVILLAEAVHHAHEAGVVHGALTPGNIIMSRDGSPYICDFGALKALQSVPALKKAFAPRGRSSYRAPEVAQGEEPSVESDIFSLGAIAYEMLTLREAITGQGGQLSTRREALPPPSRLDRRINTRLDPILMRPLEQLPQRRFKSARDFAAALRNFLASSGGVPTGRDLTKFVGEVFPRDMEPKGVGGPVPFTDAVELVKVEGASLPPLIEKSMVMSIRPSFSGGEVDPNAETDFAVPIFREPGEEAFPDEKTDRGTPGRPKEEPRFDDGTDPGQAGPLERGWDAPTGMYVAPPRGSRSVPTCASRALPRNPRVKVIEDFAMLPSSEPSETKLDPREPPQPSPRKGGVRLATDTEVERAPTAEVPTVMPQNTAERVARMHTAERYLWVDSLKRKRSMIFAAVVALIGVVFFIFALAARMGEGPVATPDGLVEEVPVATPEAPPIPEPPVVYDSPPSLRRAGFLTVTSDTAAVVYIDGKRVRQKAPLTDYPVVPGARRVVVESTRHNQKHVVVVEVGRGRSITVDAVFEKKRR